MNLIELKEKIQDKTFHIDLLQVKKYLPILHKKIIIDNLISDVISYDKNDIAFIDTVQRKISFSIAILLNYCDLEIQENDTDMIIEVLDLLYETGVYSQIEQAIDDDLIELDFMFEQEVESIKARNNTVEAVLAKVLNKLVDKIPDEKSMKKLIKFQMKNL